MYAHIFIRKMCFCYACRSAGVFFELLGRAGFLMDMYFLCVFWNQGIASNEAEANFFGTLAI